MVQTIPVRDISLYELEEKFGMHDLMRYQLNAIQNYSKYSVY